MQAANSFELTRTHAQDYFKQGIVLVGDAAHTINPLAGQGVNLGFKDANILLEVLQQASQKKSLSPVMMYLYAISVNVNRITY